jgi:hypothetical protein
MIAAQTFAGDLAGYHGRVHEAMEFAGNMVEEEGYCDETRVSTIKEFLPKSERVEFGDVSVTVDNAWLHEMLDACASESDDETHAKLLDEISDRLIALDNQVNTAAEASTDGAMNAGERIREILARPAYREKTESELTRMIKEVRRRVFEFITDLLRRIFGSIVGTGSSANVVFLAIIVLGVGAALILSIRMLRRRQSVRKEKKQTVLGEEIEEGVTPADLAAAALAAGRAGDYRTAIRKLYISLLYELAERNIIEIESQATNREYLARVSGFPPLLKPMRYLTDRFDYFWYGMFASSEEDFKEYLNSYGEAMEKARTIE